VLDNDPTSPEDGLENNPENNPEDPTGQHAETGATGSAAADTPAQDNTPDAPQASDAPEIPDSGDSGVAVTKPAKKAAAKKAAKAPAKKAAAKKTTAKKTARSATSENSTPETATEEIATGETTDVAVDAPVDLETPAEKPKKKAAARKRSAAKRTESASESASGSAASVAGGDDTPPDTGADSDADAPSTPAPPMVLFQAPEPTKAPARKRTTRKVAASKPEASVDEETGVDPQSPTVAADDSESPQSSESSEDNRQGRGGRGRGQGGQGGNRRGQGGQRGKTQDSVDEPDTQDTQVDRDRDDQDRDDQDRDDQNRDDQNRDDQDDSDDDTNEGEGGARRRRRRGGRRRRKPSDGEGGNNGDADTADDTGDKPDDAEDADDSDETGDGDNENGGSRRRRRRRRPGEDGSGSGDSDSGSGNNRARKQRNPEDEITSIGGSTRLEAKKQRRREGREAGRRRAPIVSEAEFLARRESVDRVMVIRQKDDLTQIGVLEDKVLVEHYVARESQTSLIGNIYLGRVQNVLPSMEAAFIDIGKGRNAVLYAGEVNWAAVGHKDGQQRKIESVLSSGQTILVQVSKDPVGHKGARLTGQISLPGRFLVYVPDGNTSGISRKLPDTERNRLKTLLKRIVPDSAGVIVRTAAEGASEEELTLDVERLTARWADIEEKVKSGKSPQLLYGEPDLTLKVVRDLFTEDFAKLVVQGDDAWDLVENYVSHVAPDLKDRLERFEPAEDGPDSKKDLFATYRVDEQIAKGLDRKVWLPSGGSLVIDRTEAMTVVDVNTGKFTGSGGNLEETVTKNNLEAAEEMVRQLRLRDIGGIIVIDFIDMVLESNRDLVLRRLVECLGRDRTRHQVAEVTSLGLVQMTRKRIGTGLVEAFSSDCSACNGRGVVVHEHPVEPGSKSEDDDSRGRGRGRGGRNRGRGNDSSGGNGPSNGGNGASPSTVVPSPADLAKSRPPEKASDDEDAEGASSQDAAVDSTATPATGTEDAAQQSVIGTPTGSAAEPQHVPAEQGAASTQPETPPETQPETPPETQPETPAETPAEAPRVVTSTRRRTARRPAGPPSPIGEAGSLPGAGRQAPPSAEPVHIPVEPAVPGHAPEAEPHERGQVTDPASIPEPVAQPDPETAEGSHEESGRADGARAHGDPTWPAHDLTEADEGEGEGDGEQEGDDEDSGSVFSLLHVPIKRKGSRKR
jgi:ribonuclease E